MTKLPRFPFDKLPGADRVLGTQMKATGEVMSVGRTFPESLLKAVRSLETGHMHLSSDKLAAETTDALLAFVRDATDERLFALAELFRRGVTIGKLHNLTGIDAFFLAGIRRITEEEIRVKNNPGDLSVLSEAKCMGFSDAAVARLWGRTEAEIRTVRQANGIMPVYKMIDTCSAEFESYVPYFYSTWEEENESVVS